MNKLIWLIILCVCPIAQSGDPIPWYKKFEGYWNLTNCKGGEKFVEEKKGFYFGTTGSRGKFFNVYLLNPSGKKVRLYFTTSKHLPYKGIYEVKQDHSGKSGVHVNLANTERKMDFELRQEAGDRLKYYRTSGGEKLSCDVIKFRL